MGGWQSRQQTQRPDYDMQVIRAPHEAPALRKRYMNKCVPLHKAAIKGDWDAAAGLLEDSYLLTDELTEGRETVLHIAAVEGHVTFVGNLLDRMNESDVRTPNKRGNTALVYAVPGSSDIVRMMVDRFNNLPKIRCPAGEGVTPLFMAAVMGHSQDADYLFRNSDFESWTPQEQFKLLMTSIESELYGLAKDIVDNYPYLAVMDVEHAETPENLAVMDDEHAETPETPLTVLARNPSAFRQNYNQRAGLFDIIFGSKERNDERSDANILLDHLWDKIMWQRDIDIESGKKYDEKISNVVFVAAKAGNYHFLKQLIDKDPAFLYKVDYKGHSIYHIAISNRHVEIFNLIYELKATKDLMPTYEDKEENIMLHLAAMKAPAHALSGIPGAALQMQREVLWYKAVENIVKPKYRNWRNKAGQTPHELFLQEHEKLIKDAERELKQTAKSCMLVATLLTTVVYPSAFTLPGGNDDHTRDLMKENQKYIVGFLGLATLSSLLSTLTFLSILISRYRMDDFVKTLPLWLVTGVISLFVSIMATMGAFCVWLLVHEHGWVGLILLICFSWVPITFVALKYQLLVGTLRCTFSSRGLFGSNNALFP